MDSKQRFTVDKDVRIESIRTVLNLYPFSIGIFREILQNSEDAKASKQVFLLDCRTHPPANLCGTALEHTNGPALLAFNNATFSPDDWEGILTLFKSSKRGDASKIGKYGMGFRACFHVTNYPQIFSKDSVVMLDPQGNFFDEGWGKAMLEEIPVEIRKSLNLAWFQKAQSQGSSPGTIIRLPLRTGRHQLKISSKTVSCKEVEDHFKTFVRTEMDICLLFLSSLQSIEFWVIREGETTPSRIALSSITPVVDASPSDTALKRRVRTRLYSNPIQEKHWLVRWYSISNSESQDQLSTRIGCDVKPTMESEKLTATVALAIQTDVSPDGTSAPGRLFTYLPLPSDTNYPCNIHAPFALTIDRQTLRNELEEGLVKGSDDHIRVEWNRYLFDSVIPMAWAELLLDLSKLNRSLFSAWPSTRKVPGGCSYWQCVPRETMRWIVNNNVPVWPVQGPSIPPAYHRCEEVLVAPPSITMALLDAFASVGLTITQPPQEVYDLVHEIQCHQLLTPELAHATILKLELSETLDKGQRHLLLDYLLSTGRVENIIGIPLVEQVDGSVVALFQRVGMSPNHVLLEESDQAVFSQFDPQAISIARSNLPSTTIWLLKSTTLLDVESLKASHVMGYIDCAINHFGPFPGVSSSGPEQYIYWVSGFFEWLQCSSLEKTLHSNLHTHPLLPVNNGQLKPISSGVFSATHDYISDSLVQLLQSLGLSCVHPNISAPAQMYLDPYLKSLNNPSHVFTSIPPLHQELSDPEIYSLQEYILSHKWAIQKDQVILAILRTLPIHNRMVPSNTFYQSDDSMINYLIEWSSIPDGVVIRVVAPDVTLLPIVPNTFFTSQLSLMQVIDKTLAVKSTLDVLQLVIQHFQSQSPDLQAKFLGQFSTMHIPSTSLSHFKSIPFVLGADEQLHSPQTLVDPASSLANLLPLDSPHLPQYQTPLQKEMVDSLRSLSLLPKIFTQEIFQEIVAIITTTQDTHLSNSLLDFLDDDTTSWSIPDLLLDHPWLDTTKGLSPPAGSHDYRHAKLCNRVLPLLKRAKRIQSKKLLRGLHWNKPLTLQVIVDQFKALVNEGKPYCPELLPVTSFLGSHLKELSKGNHLQELEQFTKGRSWVPTTGSTLTSTTLAIFKQDLITHPFKQITPLFADDKDARSFLQVMGCMEKPSEDAISLILQDLGNIPAAEVAAFLRGVDNEKLNTVLGNIGVDLPIIPTTDGTIKACLVTYFNDLGPEASEVPLPPGYSIASDHVDRNLALKLGLSFLSDRFSMLDDDDSLMEMKEELTTRVSGVLLSYTKEQAFMESLANAADAGATEFGVTQDVTQYSPQEDHQFVSLGLKELCGQPSLILHNNGVFSPSDWKGICSVGSGSKQGNVDGKPKIGRFGLGALSMFYFTEVIMVVSGCYVLFMDPRKAYLGRGRSCYKVSLENMKRHFPAHLSLLHGHYGYDYSKDEYNGTLFKLHLRTEQQASKSTIYQKSFNKREIKSLITDFKKRAQHALFFTSIRKIRASYPAGTHDQETWVVEKTTEDLPDFSGVVGIQHSSQPNVVQWSVLFKTVPLLDIPPKFHQHLSVHKIQAVSIGIAGALDTKPPHHRPFFGLPLLDTISLPIHLHCTFILSDNRRSIRYDEKGEGNVESQFNKWLLTEKVPSFYLQFLAGWDQARPMNECPWWPKGTEQDTLSQAVAQAIWTTLPTSNEVVCDTYSGDRIAPSKAHFLQPPCPEGLLLALCPEGLTIIPPGFSHQSSLPLRNIDNNCLITILQHNVSSIISMYEEGRITVDDVVDVTRILKPSSLFDFLGLPLLPLADGTLAPLSANHTTFYPHPQKPKNPFPLHHFLDPRITKQEDRNIYTPLQVRHLDNMAISRLIMTKIPEQDTFSSSPALESWLKELWEFLDTTYTPIEDPAFQQLPLISTYSRPEAPTRISFQKLARSDVLFIDRLTDVPLDACVSLGMKLIRASDCSRRLCDAIRSRSSRGQSFELRRAVISFFADLPYGQISQRFQRLDDKRHSEFSQWFRSLFSNNSRFLPAERAIIEQIPVWEVVQVGLPTAKFVPASTAFVIPEGVDPDVVKTWTKESTAYVPADHVLSLIRAPITLQTFYTDHLSFPPAMVTVTRAYKSLLEKVLHSSMITQPSILVPNANGRMTPSNELYRSSNTTFASGFASQNRMFLHPNLRDLEPHLCRWGMINTITAQSFIACASAIHQDVSRPDVLTRALIVFGTYSTEMPRKLLGDRDSQNALRNLRFIPRRAGSTRYGSVPTDLYHNLPDIVSPSEILDSRFVSVAWTQRAICLEEPSPELLSVNNAAWQPTATEVIKHLYLLSTKIAPNLPCNSELIKDLKATYSWLADHEGEVEGLLDYNQDKLFLNVDNPDFEWRWYSASELLFDEKDSTNRVRQFLKSYSGLLRAAGVKEISHVSVPTHLLHEDSDETQLAHIRNGFNKMREAGQLTDVAFTAKDGTEFPAHRVFLAARSGYFETYFAVGWRESKILEEIEIDVDYSRECLEAVLDWIYKGSYSLPAEETEKLSVLEEMYRLAHYWDFADSDLFKGLTRELIQLIDRRTYSNLRKLAEDLRLEDGSLAKMCEEFERKNRSVLAESR